MTELARRCEEAEIALHFINELRSQEGDCVTILSDNPDYNGQVNNAVICNGGWTDYGDRRFVGDTLHECLAVAYAAWTTVYNAAALRAGGEK